MYLRLSCLFGVIYVSHEFGLGAEYTMTMHPTVVNLHQ